MAETSACDDLGGTLAFCSPPSWLPERCATGMPRGLLSKACLEASLVGLESENLTLNIQNRVRRSSKVVWNTSQNKTWKQTCVYLRFTALILNKCQPNSARLPKTRATLWTKATKPWTIRACPILTSNTAKGHGIVPFLWNGEEDCWLVDHLQSNWKRLPGIMHFFSAHQVGRSMCPAICPKGLWDLWTVQLRVGSTPAAWHLAARPPWPTERERCGHAPSAKEPGEVELQIPKFLYCRESQFPGEKEGSWAFHDQSIKPCHQRTRVPRNTKETISCFSNRSKTAIPMNCDKDSDRSPFSPDPLSATTGRSR